MSRTIYPHLRKSSKDAAAAQASSLILSRHAGRKTPLKLRVQEGSEAETLEIPASALSLLADALGTIAAGRGVTLVAQDAELTTAQAADILNVSRPYVIKLLEEGKIPHRKTGTHRRIRLEDVLDYKAESKARKERAIDRLVADAQEQGGMGYE